MNKRFVKGVLLALAAGLLWGVSGNCGQYLFSQRGVDPQWLVAVRLLVSGAVLLLMSLIQQGGGRTMAVWKNGRDIAALLLFALLGMMAVQYTYFVAIAVSNAATATVLQYLGPVLIMIYLSLRAQRIPSVGELTAIGCAVAGIFFLVTHGSWRTLAISGEALFWGLASALALAFYTIWPEDLLQRYGNMVIVGWGMFLGGVALSLGQPLWPVAGEWDGFALLLVLFVVFLGSLVAFSIYLESVSCIGAQRASLLACVEPLSAAFVSVVWLKSAFGPMDWLGGGLIVLTVFLIALGKKPA